MTARVVGLDLSLTAIGQAVIGTDIGPRTFTHGSLGRRADSVVQRRQRLRDLADSILDNMGAAVALVVVEGPSVMSRGGSNWDRAGLWWLVVEPLAGRYPIAVAAPTVVKKWAAGKGTADKAAVAAGVTRLWPEVEPANDNEFDALALATMGAQKLGLAVPSRAHHADALLKVEWPPDWPLGVS